MSESVIADRAYHRPVSMLVETIERLPYERTLPSQTQMTVNLGFSRENAQKMIDFLQSELARAPDERIYATITGPTP